MEVAPITIFTRSKLSDARLQRFQIECKSDSFAEVLVIFALAHKVLQRRNGNRLEWGHGGWNNKASESGWNTLMSARSSVSCSSDMDNDWSVSLRSSSALFCRAFKIPTETNNSMDLKRQDVHVKRMFDCTWTVVLFVLWATHSEMLLAYGYYTIKVCKNYDFIWPHWKNNNNNILTGLNKFGIPRTT